MTKTKIIKKELTQPKSQKPMRILLSQDVFAKLEAALIVSGFLEFSGFGFVEVESSNTETVFNIYDVVVLDVGSMGYTEIPAEKLLPLLDRSDAGKMKLWFHRHPLGDGTPGPHNWSGTDNATAEREPLGSVPEMVKWSISMVRTPQAWVGRFDNYKDGRVKTRHIPVEIGVSPEFIANVAELRKEYEWRYTLEQASIPLALQATRKHGSRTRSFLGSLRKRIVNFRK
jgi:hypothetical protein